MDVLESPGRFSNEHRFFTTREVSSIAGVKFSDDQIALFERTGGRRQGLSSSMKKVLDMVCIRHRARRQQVEDKRLSPLSNLGFHHFGEEFAFRDSGFAMRIMASTFKREISPDLFSISISSRLLIVRIFSTIGVASTN